MTKKPKTAIGAMLNQIQNQQMDDKSQVSPITKVKKIYSDFNSITTNIDLKDFEEILELPTDEFALWKFKDRPKIELGDLNALAEDIKLHGQTQPGLVRKLKVPDGKKKYEIIFGERRWRACQLANKFFKVILTDINDQQAAWIQISENSLRKDLSDYAKGMNYYNLIQEGIVTQQELQESLGLTKTDVSRYLSFASIPQNILNAINDLSHISSYVASIIRAYANKGDEYVEALIKIGPKVSKGLGQRKLEKLLSDALTPSNAQKNLPSARVIKGKANRHLFTLARTANETLCIRFPRDIAQVMDLDFIEQNLLKLIEKQMKANPKSKELEIVEN